MAETTNPAGQQADYPNLDPYGNSNGSSNAAAQAENAKNKAMDSKVRHIPEHPSKFARKPSSCTSLANSCLRARHSCGISF